MNENPQSTWKKPLTGKSKWLAWFAIFAILLFIVVCIRSTVSNERGGIGGLILFASLIAIVGSLLALLLILFVRWLCCWRNFRRFLFGTACFITLIFLAYAEENWRGKSAWTKHRREWEAKGEKFTLSELTPRPVLDDQNFAFTPLLKPAMYFAHSSTGLVWLDTNGLARLDKLRTDLSPGRDTNDQLRLGSLEKGTFADLAACREFYRGNTNYPQPATSGTAAEDILVALGRFDPEFKELHEAMVTRPLVRYPIEYDYEPSWGILLPHLARLKGFVQLTHLRATAELEAGRSGEALADLKLGLRFSDSIRDEPILIDHLVRIATLSINLQTVREGLVRHAWTDAQLAELENLLASANVLAEYKLAMRGERAFGTSGLDWLRRQGPRGRGLDSFGNEEGGGALAPNFNVMPGGLFYQNMLTISEMHQNFSLATVDERTHRVFPEISENEARALEKMRAGPYTIFARLLLPALEKAVRKSARMQTSVDAARVACALERQRLASGMLPETLDALVPRYLEKIPTDVIDGKPLRYRLNADKSYVLYSIGWNQTDDGGELAWTRDKSPNVDVAKGDWVWQMPGR